MDFIENLLTQAAWPILAIFTHQSEITYWVYLVCTLVLALGVTLTSGRGRTISAALAHCFPKSVYEHPSARADYALWFLNNLFTLAVLPLMCFSMSEVQASITGLLAATFGGPGPGLAPGLAARALYTLTDVLAVDAGLFLMHYLDHRVPVLWEFHKTHHSAEVLTPITVFRMHPVDIWLNAVVVTAFLGVNAGIFGFLFGEPPRLFAVMGLNVVDFAILALGYHLRHSHIWLMYPPIIARHISSPAMHLIHHSRDPRHWDKNLGRIFNFWDRLAGTLYLPTEEEAIAFGLGGDEQLKFRSVSALYGRPISNVVARWRGWFGSGADRPALDAANSAEK